MNTKHTTIVRIPVYHSGLVIKSFNNHVIFCKQLFIEHSTLIRYVFVCVYINTCMFVRVRLYMNSMCIYICICISMSFLGFKGAQFQNKGHSK